MGCGSSKVDDAPKETRSEDLQIARTTESHLNVMRSASFHPDPDLNSFDLALCREMCLISRLVYLDDNLLGVWSSNGKAKGDFSKGLGGMSPVAKFWLGDLANKGVTSIYPLRGSAVGAEFDMTWDNGAGQLKDGLINSERTDTQGFIIVRPATKTVILAMRGTEVTSFGDVVSDMYALKGPAFGGNVHKGILNAWKSVEEGVMTTLRKLFDAKQGDKAYNKLILTGHSLGGGLATFAAASAMEAFGTEAIKMQLYTFGGVVVGDPAFQAKFDAKLKLAFRVVNNKDAVPRLPLPGFKHIGTLIFINANGLWIDPNPSMIKEEITGDRMAMAKNHSMTFYLKLIESFIAMCAMKHAPVGGGEISCVDLEPILQKAWGVCLHADTRAIAKTQFVLSEDGLSMQMRRIQGPNIEGLVSTFMEKCPGLEEENVKLLEAEMMRLQQRFERLDVDWSLFVCACFNLFFAGKGVEFNLKRAKAFEAFARFDYSGDNFLNRKEFDAFYTWAHPNLPNDEKTASAMFKKLDMNEDGLVHFEEYLLFTSIQSDIGQGKRPQLKAAPAPSIREAATADATAVDAAPPIPQ